MFKPCWIAFAAPRKSYRIGLLLIQKNGWGSLSVTERSYGPAPISKAESLVGGGGGGVLPYMGYIGISSCEGYSFQAVYSWIGYLNQRVWV